MSDTTKTSNRESPLLHVEHQRRLRVRQDRHTPMGESCTVSIGDKTFNVMNYSSFGVAIIHDQGNFPGETFDECVLKVDKHPIASLSLKKVRVEKLEDGRFKIAFEVLSDPIPVEKLSALPEVLKIVDDLLSERQAEGQLPLSIRAPIYDLKALLEKFEKKVNAFGAQQKFQSQRQLMDFEQTVTETVATVLVPYIESFFSEMQTLLKGSDPETVRKTFRFFRNEVRELLFHSPFMYRTLEKPLGYAGDFEVMNLIYRDENLGASLFHKCIERFFLFQPEPHAVRNRVKYLHTQIISLLGSKKGSLRLLSVASGPAMEVQRLIEQLDQPELSRLEIHLLDQDIVSLKHAQRQIEYLCRGLKKKIHVEYHHKTIKEVIATGIEKTHYDLIYSAGLFDYFTDQVAQIAGAVLFKGVKPGGELIIGNFDISTPNAFAMSMIWDWNLIYRSQSDLKKLFLFPASTMEIETEEKGINLFCVMRKNG